jgi:hypothetical protein
MNGEPRRESVARPWRKRFWVDDEVDTTATRRRFACSAAQTKRPRGACPDDQSILPLLDLLTCHFYASGATPTAKSLFRGFSNDASVCFVAVSRTKVNRNRFSDHLSQSVSNSRYGFSSYKHGCTCTSEKIKQSNTKTLEIFATFNSLTIYDKQSLI